MRETVNVTACEIKPNPFRILHTANTDIIEPKNRDVIFLAMRATRFTGTGIFLNPNNNIPKSTEALNLSGKASDLFSYSSISLITLSELLRLYI
jgi:hypothetical protein